MRIIKEPEIRKNEILDVAEQLFETKGFDGTSTNDILEKAGIARGTLYYHFKSKEDIMDALIERIKTRIVSAATQVASDKDMPVFERLLRAVWALNVSGQNNIVIEHIHKPQNALMHQKIRKFILNEIPPILTGIIKDGIGQGIFNTPYPYESMEMAMCYINDVIDGDLVELSEEERGARVTAFAFNVERLFGMEPDSFTDAMGMFGNEGEVADD
ncbi:MAG TPA: TetR/AcrR family transcriptional regulator [Candidatus Acidoferrum sp.]|nr:TetR/AcrR family transcriptional regulator [Candidatus Acidoferrum sp.]